MVAGFHLLGQMQRGHFLLSWVRKLIPYLILLYGLGAGLIAATLFNQDAVAALLSSAGAGEIVIGIVETVEPEEHWLEWFLNDITSPIALAAFSLGIGGLAIVNLFVAHELIHLIVDALADIRARKINAQHLKTEYAYVLECLENYRENHFDLGETALWTAPKITRETALQLSELIESHKRRHEAFIKRREINGKRPRHRPDDLIDAKAIERDLKKIDALDFSALHQMITRLNPLED